MKLIECVPNFSEGRELTIIDAITAEIASVTGAELLDVDPGADTNRTVVTFVGGPAEVAEAAFRAIAKASDLIDMRSHSGAHPRMGATDVCPFVPVSGVTMEECVAIAREVAMRVGTELDIPVYLYEHAAPGGRRSLADARRGEYEGLANRDDAPDFGPKYNPASGATAIGAREFLIAYNVNLNTKDRRLAHQVAQAVRELGTPKRGSDGKLLKDDAGKTIFVPGRFKECKAVGWYLPDYGRAQVSINLTDHHVTSVHAVFDACRDEAAKRGMRVTGSELVGLIPKSALLAAGDHYLNQQGKSTGLPESDRIAVAVLSLGLDELGPFDPKDRIVEYRAGTTNADLVLRTVASFLDELSTDSPAPGGGSVAALCGALAGSLTAMVAALSHSKKGWEHARPQMQLLGQKAQELKAWFTAAVDRDTDAFNDILAAVRLPRKTEEESARRNVAMDNANLAATLVPLEVMEHAVEVLVLAMEATQHGNPNSVSDAGVAGICALAAAQGASLNVRINLPQIAGPTAQQFVTRHDGALSAAEELAQEIDGAVGRVLGEIGSNDA